MKKLFLILIILTSVIACKKTKFSPEGPTDIRVKNLSDVTFTEVIVNTSEDIDTLGNIAAGSSSEYYRFDKAYPKAEITARINGVLFSTGGVDYRGMTYIGEAKITYEVFIENAPNKKLKISNCSLDSPLK
jgi:hypothetical protein